MADNKLLQQMLEHLVNDEQAKAEELFHEYVVSKSREICEGLIEDDLEEAAKEEDEDEDMDEAAKASKEEDEEDLDESSEEDEDEEDMDENFDAIASEGGDDMDDMGGDPTDDLEGELDGEEGEKSEEELFQDLDAIVDELQAKFDALKGHEEGEGELDMGGADDEMKDSFELETVREYVEKVSDGHGAEKKGKGEDGGTNTKSIIDNMKNDMGGTTANILSGRNGADAGSVGAGGKIKGSALSDQNPKEDNAGNINVPGGKAGKTGFTHKEPGHGAEKKGQAEQADNKQSLSRGRR